MLTKQIAQRPNQHEEITVMKQARFYGRGTIVGTKPPPGKTTSLTYGTTQVLMTKNEIV